MRRATGVVALAVLALLSWSTPSATADTVVPTAAVAGAEATLLDFFYHRLVPALNVRCDLVLQARPVISRGVYHGARDSEVSSGADGWTTRSGSLGVPLVGAHFIDADGSGSYSYRELMWLDVDGDHLLDAG